MPFGKEAHEWNHRFALIDRNVGRPEMAAERLSRIVARIAAAGGSASTPGPLCEVAADIVGVTGAGVMVLADGVPQASLCTTGPVSALIEELQYTLGEGPCVDAHRSGKVITEPDLAAPAMLRWPAFAPPVVDAGARAIFGFPIRIGAARIGALNLYRDRSGLLSDDQHADALVMAEVIAWSLLSLQAHAEAGSVPSELDTGIQTAVHQAAGMVAIQLAIPVGDALARLRAYAFRTDLSLIQMAHEVVARRLRFDDLEKS